MALWIAALVVACSPQWARARIGKGWQELTEASFSGFLKSNERVMVDFYDPREKEWSNHAKELEAALVTLRSYGKDQVPLARVDASKETSLAKEYVKNSRFPQLMWFVHGKPTQYHRTLRTSKMIADFVSALDRPAVQQVGSMAEALDYNRAVFAEVSKTSPLFHALEVMAMKHMDTIAFTHMDSPKEQISFLEGGKDKVEFTGGSDAVALERWIRERLPLKSEEIPEGGHPVEANCHTVVANNFEENIFLPDKDVMLLVHAPWCGFCKKLQPTWEALSKAVEGVVHLRVAKMDGSRNDSPLPYDFSWDAYPTIFYVRAGERWPTIYSGNRTVESLVAFATTHTSKPFDLDSASIIIDSDL